MIEVEYKIVINESDVSEYQIKVIKNIYKSKAEKYLIIPEIKKSNNEYNFLFEITENLSNKKIGKVCENKKLSLSELEKKLYKLREFFCFIDDMLLEIKNILLDFEYIYSDNDQNFYYIYIPYKYNGNENKDIKENVSNLVDALEKKKIIDNNKCKKIKVEFLKKIRNYDNENDIYILLIDEIIKNINSKHETFKKALLIIFIILVIAVVLIKIYICEKLNLILLGVLLFYIFLLYKVLKSKIKNRNAEKQNENMITKVINKKVFLQEKIFKIRHYISKDRFIIGKSNECDMRLNVPTISSEHLVIFKNSDRWFIRDLGSKNHTYLNGILLKQNENIRLNNKDEICILNKKYTFINNE